MPTKAKKPKRDASGWVKASAFRLGPATLDDLDQIAAEWTRATGTGHTRTDVIRIMAKTTRDAIERRGK